MDQMWYTVKEVADLMRVDKKTIYKRIAKNEIPAKNFGTNCTRIPKFYIDELLKVPA